MNPIIKVQKNKLEAGVDDDNISKEDKEKASAKEGPEQKNKDNHEYAGPIEKSYPRLKAYSRRHS